MSGSVVCALCLAFVASEAPGGDHGERLRTCVEVGAHAVRLDVPVPLALALAAREGRFDPTAGKPGDPHVGALQANFRWCPGETDAEGCGVAQLAVRLCRTPDWRRAVCHYNQGNKCRTEGGPSGKWAKRWAWAGGVAALARRIERKARALAAVDLARAGGAR